MGLIKGCMFAAAKNSRSVGGEEFIKQFWLLRFKAKKTLKKISKKHCEFKKRVLHLHPLSKETS
ncbi:hypothetical protein C1A40_17250 [Tamlana carrageenivorans]|uniref:Uncharacterized protein n=1 Tax=Pseudotamlana carrageenivorans TaxID=2069432 RepID=A0A2I7SME7_9FLAO|nr:hypothetical protein C1A40_17250 [Tamlana carrageenivorans]